MGLIAEIFKTDGLGRGTDFSNGGISKNHNAVTIVNIDGPFDADVDRPAVMLLPGRYPASSLPSRRAWS